MHPLRALRTQSKETQGRHEDSDEDLPGAGLMQRERTTSSCGTEGPHRHFCSRRSSDSSAAGDSKDFLQSVPDSSPLSEKPVCFDPSASSRRLEELVGRRRRIQAVSRKFRRALPSFRSEFKSRAAEEADEGGARTTRATRATAPKQTEKGSRTRNLQLDFQAEQRSRAWKRRWNMWKKVQVHKVASRSAVSSSSGTSRHEASATSATDTAATGATGPGASWTASTTARSGAGSAGHGGGWAARRWAAVKGEAENVADQPNLEAVMVQRSLRKHMIRSLRFEAEDREERRRSFERSGRLSALEREFVTGMTLTEVNAEELANKRPSSRPARFDRPAPPSRPHTVGEFAPLPVPKAFFDDDELTEGALWSVLDR